MARILHFVSWGRRRSGRSKASTHRFEIRVENQGVFSLLKAHSAAEALRVARLHADSGARVFVRDLTKRRGGYLREAELAFLAQEEG